MIGYLAVSPDGWDHWVESLAPEAGVRHAQVLAPPDEGQRALLQVQHHQEGVGHLVARVA